jgi:Bacterial SH3 domain
MDNRKISDLSSQNTEPKPSPKKEPAVSSPPSDQPAQQPEAQAPKTRTQPKRPTAAPKPIVEGINSTLSTLSTSSLSTNDVISVKRPTFTEQEKILISETETPKNQTPRPRLMPESVAYRSTKKHSSIVGVLTTAIILLILIGGVYEFYVWQLQKNSGSDTVPTNTSLNTSASTTDMTDTTTPEGLTPEGSTSTTSSTISSMPFPLAGGAIATGTPPSSTSTAPALQLKITSTPTGYLNVRSGPSTSDKVIGQVHPGEIYTYTSTQPGWYLITIPEMDSGWVSSQYVTLQ